MVPRITRWTPEPSFATLAAWTKDGRATAHRGGIARATFHVAVSGRSRDSQPSFFTVVAWRDQAEHATESLSRGIVPQTSRKPW
jgi:hypothetical protein